MLVIKKDGNVEDYDSKKIEEAVLASAKQVMEIGQEELNMASSIAKLVKVDVYTEFEGKLAVPTSRLHEIVQKNLSSHWDRVYEAYATYRNYKKEMAASYKKMYDNAEGILYSGDTENANKDSRLNSTKQSLIGGVSMKEFVRKFEMAPKWIEAHDKGFIHIHDMGERFLRTQNCCLFNMGGLLNGGFSLNGSEYIEPKSIQAALAVIGDITLSASAQQYGR